MLARFARLLRLVSVAACLIVCASFLVFAVDQTGTASHHQQEVLAPAAGAPAPAEGGRAHESAARSTLDQAASDITAPFAGIVSRGDGEWASRGARLLLALVVYGFGIGYLVRVIRVRV